MSISRSWTLIAEETEINDSDRAYLDGLMEKWSAISTEVEDEGFRRQAAMEDGYDEGPDFDTDEEYKEFEQVRKTRSQRRQVKLDIIEAMLHSHGARVMRPYEHWNEDEAYMAYQERDRDY